MSRVPTEGTGGLMLPPGTRLAVVGPVSRAEVEAALCRRREAAMRAAEEAGTPLRAGRDGLTPEALEMIGRRVKGDAQAAKTP